MRRKWRLALTVCGLCLVAWAAPGAGSDAGLPPGGTFTDDDGTVHEGYIEAIAAAGITKGCNPPDNTHYCPNRAVTRGETAAFLTRALQLPPGTPNHFTDDDTSIFDADIEAIAAAGITKGCNPPDNTHYCPNRAVTRGETAAFLTRALQLPPGTPNHFTDDDTSIFEADIEAIAAAGITKGCNPPDNTHYCPDAPVLRAQMASFVGRALDLTPVVPPPWDPAVPRLVLRRAGGVPAMPDGGSLRSLTAAEDGFLALVRGDDTAELWRSPDGATWTTQPLPAQMVGDVYLRGAAAAGDTTFVYGERAAGLVPTVWASTDSGAWRPLDIELRGAAWGSVWWMTACPQAVTFTGHESASNQVLEYRLWVWDGADQLVTGWTTDSGPPGSGVPPPFVMCGDGEMLALVTVGFWPPESSPVNQVWSSRDGFDWLRRAADAVTPPLRPHTVVQTSHGAVALAAPRVVAASPDGLSWRAITSDAFDDDDWIMTAGGGVAGVVAFGLDHLGDQVEPVMWWSADGETWQRIPHPVLWDGTYEAGAAANETVVMIAPGDGTLWRGMVEP